MKNITNLNLQFTDEEKRNCLPTALKILALCEYTREQGIISLENEVAKEHIFIRIAAGLLLEGFGYERMEETLLSYILVGNYMGSELINRLIITEGFVSLAKTYRLESPLAIAYAIGSFLGEEYIEELIAAVTGITPDLNALINENTYFLPESQNFQDRLLTLTKRELSLVLSPSDYVELAEALKGCDIGFIKYIRDGVSEHCFVQICKTLAEIDPG